jgi:hypothetical protein
MYCLAVNVPVFNHNCIVLRRKVDKEGGANFGITLPTKPDGGTSKVSDFIGCELRYNIPNTKFDFGV